jgi:hypothetical protein
MSVKSIVTQVVVPQQVFGKFSTKYDSLVSCSIYRGMTSLRGSEAGELIVAPRRQKKARVIVGCNRCLLLSWQHYDEHIQQQEQQPQLLVLHH